MAMDLVAKMFAVGLPAALVCATVCGGVLLIGAFILLSKILLANLGVEENRALQHRSLWLSSTTPVIAFFHPFCDGGGGGERVLWVAIHDLQQRIPDALFVVYSHDKIHNLTALLTKVEATFGITVDPQNIDFRRLRTWSYLLPHRYPYFTLLAQSIGSIYVAWEAMQTLLPDVFVDTVGFAFTYPLVRSVFHCKVVAYVHYPTITSIMQNRVQNGVSAFNNASFISRSRILTSAKALYYSLFTKMYRRCGLDADVIMVNSSWTKAHIDDVWNLSGDRAARVVYPPSSNSTLESYSLTEPRQRIIVSIGQFRPEKNHKLQVESFKRLISKYKIDKDLRLVMVGGCRNDDDKARVAELESLIKDYGLDKESKLGKNNVYIELVCNAPYTVLVDYLHNSTVGLHTMTDEHFGISVVEYMAAGVIAVAHNSAGPAQDILVPGDKGEKYGYLAITAEEFADAMYEALQLKEKDSLALRTRARERAKTKFSDEIFAKQFSDSLISIIPSKD